jgi:hypothetical protein
MQNPYAGVNWQTVNHLMGSNQEHVRGYRNEDDSVIERDWNQSVIDSKYNHGLRHFSLSDYRPSAPYYPLEPFVHNVPSDVVVTPNSEIRWYGGRDTSVSLNYEYHVHMKLMGSLFDSRVNPSPEEPYEVYIGGSWIYDMTHESISRPWWNEREWTELVDAITPTFEFSDAGGIIIGHPQRYPAVTHILRMLDYTDRVLGVEAFSLRSGTMYDQWEPEAWDIWDEILKTGRRCFGFFTTDVTTWDSTTRGKNILLTPENNNYEAQKAYADGRFYGALRGGVAQFTEIDVNGKTINITTDNAESIKFITYEFTDTNHLEPERREVDVQGSTGSFTVSDKTVFVRAVGFIDGKEEIFTQPIRFMDRDGVASYSVTQTRRRNARRSKISSVIL